MPVQQDHLPFLDRMRGVAILAVFAYHALFQAFRRDDLPWTGWFRSFDAPADFLSLYPLTWGWSGVAIFFAISGFCIHLSHARSANPSTTQFLVRRWFRIYPPYLAALLFFGCIFPHSRVDWSTRFGAAEFFSHLLLVHNLDGRSVHAIAVAWWSIAVEFQLYLLYPILYAATRRFGFPRVAMATAVVEIGMRLAETVSTLSGHEKLPAFWIYSPFYYWFSWTIGAMVADSYLNRRPYPISAVSAPIWIALFIAADLFRPLWNFSFTFAALASAAVIVGALQKPAVPARTARIPVVALSAVGACSYSLYLIHHPLVEVMPGIVRALLPSLAGTPLRLFLACLASSLIVIPTAWYMYRWIELPGMAIGKRALRRMRNSALPQAQL